MPLMSLMSPYDYDRLYEQILAAAASRGSIGQRMQIVIDACERRSPHPDWARLRRIDFDGDLPVLKGWMADACRGGALRPGDRGLWFGLYGTASAGGAVIYDLLAASGPAYDTGSDDWRRQIVAGHVSYLDSVVLAELCPLVQASQDGLGHGAESALALGYGAIAASTALAQEPLPPQLAALRSAAVGFDSSGGGLHIGVFDNLRFFPQVHALAPKGP